MRGLKRLAAAVAAVATIAGCGAGGGQPSGGAPAPGPIGDPAPSPGPGPEPAPAPPSSSGAPILFVTQVPFGGDSFEKITGTFANHLPSTRAAPRGGDLWIAYPSAAGQPPSLRNLTAEAGFGNDIAVRDPSVHWNGQKALVSMVVGTGAQAYWQVYEVEGLGQGQTVRFTKVQQPDNYNHVSPVYDPQGAVLMVSDIPRAGAGAQHRHLYPLLDEYEEKPTNTGIWRLNPATGAVKLLHHAPSGAFRPQVDSHGRVVFTNWDHAQRDQQADKPRDYKLIDFADETASAPVFRLGLDASPISEVFPEPFGKSCSDGVHQHVFNFFLPWMMRLDGTEAETLNHIGRHELGVHGFASRVNSANPDCPPAEGLQELIGASGVNAALVNSGMKLGAFHYLREDPRPGHRGTYFAVNAPEFGTHGAGCIVTLLGAPTLRPHEMRVSLLTPRNTCGPNGPALYRSPLPLSNGQLIATTSSVTVTAPSGDSGSPYDFRLRFMKHENGSYEPGAPLTPGIVERIGSADVTMWEWDAVEVVSRSVPAFTEMEPLAPPEQVAFGDAQVELQAFRQFLTANNLALITMRDVTVRDGFDRSQPFNLRVPGSGHESIGLPGQRVFDIDHLQLFQADQLRGVGDDPNNGRRVLAQPMQPLEVGGKPVNPTALGAPQGSVKVGADGSVAAIVPADRALIWQLIDSANPGDPAKGTDGVVKERVWVSFRPGEIRTCANCHGVSEKDQRGAAFDSVVNTPLALKELLLHYKAQFAGVGANAVSPRAAR